MYLEEKVKRYFAQPGSADVVYICEDGNIFKKESHAKAHGKYLMFEKNNTQIAEAGAEITPDPALEAAIEEANAVAEAAAEITSDPALEAAIEEANAVAEADVKPAKKETKPRTSKKSKA